MQSKSNFFKLAAVTWFLMWFVVDTNAHCDSIEGPVVKAAKEALESGNVNNVLIWIHEPDEAEVQKLFQKVIRVRSISDEVREIADLYFYETVVRLHRMSEGVGYTGLKFEDYKPEEGIEAADRAIINNSIEDILNHLDESKHASVKKYFSDVQSLKNFDLNDVEAGRKYVKSYVHFIHHIESLFKGEDTHNEHEKSKHIH